MTKANEEQTSNYVRVKADLYEPGRIVSLLKRVDNMGKLAGITPDGMCVEIRSHDTATHCNILLKIPEEKPLLVWYKTNWVSSSYLQNEKGKINGIQPDCDFAEKMLRRLFDDAYGVIKAEEKRKQNLAAAQERDEIKQHRRHINRYKKYFGGGES